MGTRLAVALIVGSLAFWALGALLIVKGLRWKL
jgi:hypothetical protein